MSGVCFHILYNLFLHPLRHYPGPKLWAATRLPWCWYQYIGFLNPNLLALHSKYGHTVRIGPNELSYTADTAWKTIYGHRAVEMTRDPNFRLHTPTGAASKYITRNLDIMGHVRWVPGTDISCKISLLPTAILMFDKGDYYLTHFPKGHSGSKRVS